MCATVYGSTYIAPGELCGDSFICFGYTCTESLLYMVRIPLMLLMHWEKVYTSPQSRELHRGMVETCKSGFLPHTG